MPPAMPSFCRIDLAKKEPAASSERGIPMAFNYLSQRRHENPDRRREYSARDRTFVA